MFVNNSSDFSGIEIAVHIEEVTLQSGSFEPATQRQGQLYLPFHFAFANYDRGYFKKVENMEFKEMTLEDIIWENIQNPNGRELLKNRGLDVDGAFFRQLELGNYGRADLVSVDYNKKRKKVIITIYELKKKKIGEDALMQACRYLTALKRHGFDGEFGNYKYEYRIILIGDSIQKGDDFVYLYNSLSFVDIYTYNYKINGIFFDFVSKSWGRTEENINIETTKLLQSHLDFCAKVTNKV